MAFDGQEGSPSVVAGQSTHVLFGGTVVPLVLAPGATLTSPTVVLPGSCRVSIYAQGGFAATIPLDGSYLYVGVQIAGLPGIPTFTDVFTIPVTDAAHYVFDARRHETYWVSGQQVIVSIRNAGSVAVTGVMGAIDISTM
jgi:hypothetical protein